jgi:hypothetical protein
VDEAAEGWPTLGPFLGKIGDVPAQQGPGRDDQAQLAELPGGQQPGQQGKPARNSGALRGRQVVVTRVLTVPQRMATAAIIRLC